MDEIRLDHLEASPVLERVAGKIVFYQPWPELLVGSGGFEGQRELFTGLAEQKIQAVPEAPASLVPWILAGLLAFLACAFVGPFLPALGLVLASALLTWSFVRDMAPFTRPAAILISSAFVGLGLALIRRWAIREKRESWLRGHVAPSNQAQWAQRIPDPASGQVMEGIYVGVRYLEPGSSRLWTGWMERYSAFCDLLGDDKAGFLLAGDGEMPWIQAVAEFRQLFPVAAMAMQRGSVKLQSQRIFDHVVWALGGPARSQVLELLSWAKKGQWLFTESIYPDLRSKVKIQVLREASPNSEESGRIFNVLEVFLS
jgi:hypothetical protein